MSSKPLIIYHSPCLDGFTAAWAAWLKFPDADFHPGVHGEPPPAVLGRDVYLLDFSYKAATLEAALRSAKSLTVLDHHKTAEAELAPYLESGLAKGIFNMNKSGARLAWEHFHPDVEVPLFVRLVEDRDLWRFAFDKSKELTACFFSYDYEFLRWSTLHAACEEDARKQFMIAEGEAILRKQDKDVKELVTKLAHRRNFAVGWPTGGLILCANLPHTLSSDAAVLMAAEKDEPFAATYYQDAAGQFVFSLRSVEGQGEDVSVVAQRYGGGGHRHAAGFRVKSLEDL